MQEIAGGNPAEDGGISPSWDMALLRGTDVSGEPLSIDNGVLLNGERKNISEYPEFAAIRRKHLSSRSLGRLPTARPICPFCHTPSRVEEALHDDPLSTSADDLPAFTAITRLDHCTRCGFWQFNELRTETYDAGALLLDSHELTVVASKLRTFDEAPTATLQEIAMWFRRHPELYQSVTPRYMEELVTRIYREHGDYVEVTHVGRPDDGGVDVVLIDAEGSSCLVQVKRREDARATEPVGTIRNLLGTLVLKESRSGIVVSTADHFTYRARESAAKAASVGYMIELVNRGTLDRLLARALPAAPAEEVLARVDSERKAWWGDDS